ncbi:hypothetical protein MMOR_17350 [Mycolicibacterium moriokaense]|uniref:Head-tail adaptor protein n=1 Tax=Mycolicibacterium moriokaense TaxID=39691 RepID=A0AAD1M607_9MYCO|nr:hypothetical protein MMOR_17350 [Mycolicibacterium moriokaense]
MPGCRHRPLTFSETAEHDTNTATELWQSTVPPVAAALNATADGVIRHGGRNYRIIGGPRIHSDLSGKPVKVTIVSKLQSG